MTRPRLFDVLAVVGGVAFAAAGGELALRAFWPQRSDVTLGMFEQDPVAGYRLRGGYRNEIRVPEYRTKVLTDAEGYRVPERRTAAPPGAGRLLAIGDSFTFGVGVQAEDTFAEVLAQRLNASAPGSWEVRNGGVGGYGPLRSAHALMERQGEWRPDIVVYALYVGNDLEDSNPATFRTGSIVRDGRLVSAGNRPLLKLRLFLRTRSHLYAFLRQHFYSLYAASGLWQRSQYLDPMGLTEWPERITDVTWPAGRESIAAMRDWAQERGVRFLVVVVPTRWQVDDDAWQRYRRAWRLPDSAFDRDHAQREVFAVLAELDVPAVNLVPVLRRAQTAGVQTYYRLDPHWTPAGHRLCAQVIQLELQSLGWIGQPGGTARVIARAPGDPPAN